MPCPPSQAWQPKSSQPPPRQGAPLPPLDTPAHGFHPVARTARPRGHSLGAKQQDPLCWVLGETPLYPLPTALEPGSPDQLSLLSRAPLHRTTQEADLTPPTPHHSALFILSHEAVGDSSFTASLGRGDEGAGCTCLVFIFILFIYLAAPGLTCGTLDLFVAACGIQFPDQGSNTSSLHWEHKVLATGP